MNEWRQRLASVLEWSATDKGLIPVLFLILTNLQYMVWGQYTLQRPDSEQLINVPVMEQLFSLELAITGGALFLLVIGLLIRRRMPEFTPYQLVTTLYFAMTLVISSYYIGTMTLATGVVLLGAPVFGFILLNRGVVWISFIAATGTLIALGALTSTGALPYAPVMKPPTDPSTQVFWYLSNWLFAAPHIIVIVWMADLSLTSWRQREEMIRQMSRTDALTGIHNRRSILEMLEKEIARTHRHGPPLCVVLLDLDHFKKINDTWGHPAGDLVLKETATLLRNTIRQCDAVGRYGGEEFMILLPDTTLAGAEALVERCRAKLADLQITSQTGERIPVSGSFGLVCNEHYLAAPSEILVKEADDALYRAKEGGRNRVVALDMHVLA